MVSRRRPDSPDRLLKNAQTSAFDGSMKGNLRSARPVSRRKPYDIPNTAGNSQGGQIYRVEDGVHDVGPGDYLLDKSGQLWWKEPYSKMWTHSYSGYAEHYNAQYNTYLYPPAVVPFGAEADILLAYGSGYSNPVTGPTGSILLGQLLRSDAEGYQNVLIGYDNALLTPAGEGNGAFFHSYIIGANNELEVQAPESQTRTNVFGSWNQQGTAKSGQNTLVGDFNTMHGFYIHETSIIGHFNEINAVGEDNPEVYVGSLHGSFNSLDVVQNVSGTNMFGYINQVTVDEYSPFTGTHSGINVFGNNSTSTNSPHTFLGGSSVRATNTQNAVVIGYGLQLNTANYSVCLGPQGFVSGDYVVAMGYGTYITADHAISFGYTNQVHGINSTIIGDSNNISGDYSWILGSDMWPSSTPLTSDEFGTLGARIVEIRRSPSRASTYSPTGNFETALRLHSSDDTPADLTVDDDGVLLVNGFPVTSGGGATGYNHVQSSASTTWTIAHNLGYFPLVQAYDTAGDVISGDIHHTDVDNATVTFLTAIDGGARLI
jgi:hypothetical protein